MSDFDRFLALHGFKPGVKVDAVPTLKVVDHRVSALEADLAEHLEKEEAPDGEDDN